MIPKRRQCSLLSVLGIFIFLFCISNFILQPSLEESDIGFRNSNKAQLPKPILVVGMPKGEYTSKSSGWLKIHKSCLIITSILQSEHHQSTSSSNVMESSRHTTVVVAPTELIHTVVMEDRFRIACDRMPRTTNQYWRGVAIMMFMHSWMERLETVSCFVLLHSLCNLALKWLKRHLPATAICVR